MILTMVDIGLECSPNGLTRGILEMLKRDHIASRVCECATRLVDYEERTLGGECRQSARKRTFRRGYAKARIVP